MKILMISADPRILGAGSEAHTRMSEYAELFEELCVIVVSGRTMPESREGALVLVSTGAHSLVVRILAAWHLARARARQGQYDIITAQGADETGIVAWLAARCYRIPFQLQLHTDIFAPQYRRASWKEFVRYCVALLLVPRASCIRVVSKRIRRSLEQRYGVDRMKHVTVLPIHTDIAKFLAGARDPDTDKRFAGYDIKMIAAGRFVDREKNFSLLIEMMRDLVRTSPSTLLVIVGEGPDDTIYREKIRRYGLEKNIMLEPWHDDLASFYRSFDVFVLPSNYEGWGRAVIEAMASGLAVVMTDVGLAGDVVRDGENGLVVPVGDAAAFGRAVARIIADRDLRLRLGAAGRAAAAGIEPKTKEEYLLLYRKSFAACQMSFR